ncbi:MAG: hypothetical protein NTY77_07445 [Elusimicrobia bacterium]|nr:hypothetical protein [Elusimicrobiota bacterium]
MNNLRVMRNIAVLALAASLLGGCVSASKYKALESDNSAKGQDLAQARAKIEDLGKQLEAKNQELKTAGGKLEDLSKQLGAKDQELTKTQGKVDELAKRIEEGDKKLKQAQQDGDELKRAKDSISSQYQDHLAQSLDFLTLTKASIDKKIQELALLRKNGAAGAGVKERTGDSVPAPREAKSGEPAPEVKAKDAGAKVETPLAPKKPPVDDGQF